MKNVKNKKRDKLLHFLKNFRFTFEQKILLPRTTSKYSGFDGQSGEILVTPVSFLIAISNRE